MKKHWKLFLAGLGLTVAIGLIAHVSTRKGQTAPETELVEAPPPPAAEASVAEPEENMAASPKVGPAFAVDPGTSTSFGNAGTIGIKVTPLAGDAQSVKVHTPGFEVAELPGLGHLLQIENGTGAIKPKDSPDLPAVVRLIEGKNGYLPRVTVNGSTHEDYEGMNVVPREAFHADEDGGFVAARRPNPDIYGSDEFWPPQLVDVQQFQVDGKPVVRLEYRPLQYNPVSGKVRHHETIDSTVTFEKIDFDRLAEQKAAFSLVSSATEVTDSCDCAERTTLEDDILPPMDNLPTDFERRWSGAPSGACIKINVREQGIYRVNRATLTSQFGISAGDFANARVYTRDREVPIKMESSSFIFYGEGIRSFYTDDNAYFIGFGGPGTPARLDAAPYRVAVANTIAGAASTVSSACDQISTYPQTIWSSRNDDDVDYDGWLLAFLQEDSFGTDVSEDIVFNGVSSVAAGSTASLDVFMRGASGIIINTPAFAVSRPSGVAINQPYNPDLFGAYFENGTFNGRPQYRRSTDQGFTFTSDVLRFNGSGWDLVNSAGQGWRSGSRTTPATAGSPTSFTSSLGGATHSSGVLVATGAQIRNSTREHIWAARNAVNNQSFGDLKGYTETENALVTSLLGTSPTFPGSRLSSGTTTVRIQGNNSASLPASTIAYSYKSFIDFGILRYTRNLTGVSNRLGFGGLTGKRNYVVSSISTSGEPLLLDISDPTAPKLLDFSSTQSGNTVRFGYDSPTEPCFYLSAVSSITTIPAADFVSAKIKNLADTSRQTDYIMIVPEAFEGAAAYELLDYRAQARLGQPGLNVLVATVESIYDEFGYGIKDPAAIKQFIGFAYHHFQEPKPKYVLFAGDAINDPKLTSGTINSSTVPEAERRVDFIPVTFSKTSHAYTSVDQWYVSVDGFLPPDPDDGPNDPLRPDSLADLSLGRLPVTTTAQLQNMVNKIKTYETYGTTGFRARGLLVADEPVVSSSGIRACNISTYPANCVEFDYIQDELFNLLPQTFANKHKSYLAAGGGNINAVNNDIVGGGASSFGNVAFVNYIGHGSPSKWGLNPYPANNVFDSDDCANLNNTQLALVTVFTCQNGRFYLPGNGDSCAEICLNNTGRGAAGVIAPSGLAATRASRRMTLEFYNAMMNDRVVDGECKQNFTYVNGQAQPRVGDCMLNSFRALCYDLGDQEELRFYNLFMDPAMLHKF